MSKQDLCDVCANTKCECRKCRGNYSLHIECYCSFSESNEDCISFTSFQEEEDLKVEGKKLLVLTEDQIQEPNPIHQNKDGLWYFWDETGSEEIGPFPTRERAESFLKEYLHWLDYNWEKKPKRMFEISDIMVALAVGMILGIVLAGILVQIT